MRLSGVPVIDVSALLVEGADTSAVDAAVGEACREWGFFHATNHGVARDVLAGFDAASRGFFALGEEEKARIKRTADNSRGFFDDELTKQRRDWKECIDIGAQDGDLDGRHQVDGWNQWPAEDALPGFRPAVEAYFHACESLAERLTASAGRALGIGEEVMARHFAEGKHTSYLRMNYYPVCPDPSAHLGIERHTDAGMLTVLRLDDVASLQVWQRGQWWLVEPVEDALCINVGDMLQVVTNDRYVAPLHRVLAQPDRERHSAPFFWNPAYSADCEPAVAGEEPHYSVVNWGEFRRRRFEGDFADVGEEVQIGLYRTAAGLAHVEANAAVWPPNK